MDGEEGDLGRTVISASRVPVAGSLVGSSFSIIDRSEIEQRQVAFVGDLLRDVPGLAVSRSGGMGQFTDVRTRGAEANHTLVLIDGVKANDPAFADSFRFEQLTTADIERIEIVRGPQSGLWGSEALAGVINVVTRQSEPGTRVSGFAEGGSFSTFNGGGRAQLTGDRYTMNASLSWLDTDGENVSREGDEDDGYDNLTAAAGGSFTMTPTLTLDAGLRYNESTTEFDSVALGVPTDTDQEQNTENMYASVGGELDTLEGRWSHQLRVTYLDTDTVSDPDPFFALPGAPADEFSSDKTGVYYQTTWLIDPLEEPGHGLTLAMDYEDEDYSQRGDARFVNPNQDQSRDSWGYAAEYRVQPLDHLALTGALRYDSYDEWDDVTTWRATASWTPGGGDTRLFASGGKGMKVPTFVEQFGFFPGLFTGNPDIKPEKSEGWEVGVEQTILDGRVRGSLAYFNSPLRDEIVTVFLPDFTSTVVNAEGSSPRKGVEVALTARFSDGLDVTGSYTYTDATQPAAMGGKETEVRRPRNMASLNFNQSFLNEMANANLNISYTGSQEDLVFLPPLFAAEVKELDAYTLVNLAGEYRATDRFSFYARVENLLDEDYEDVYGYATPGIAAYLGVRVALER